MSSQPPYGQGGYQGGGYGAPPPPPPGPAPGKTKTLNLDYGVAAMLNYIPTCFCCINLVPCILWLATEPKENRFLRFHSIQGLLLFGVWVVVWILFTILGLIFGVSTAMMPGEGGLVSLGGNVVFLLARLAIGVALLIIHVIAMIKAQQGQMWKIPVIGDIAEKNS
jgi:uncharacterized membrane protein